MMNELGQPHDQLISVFRCRNAPTIIAHSRTHAGIAALFVRARGRSSASVLDGVSGLTMDGVISHGVHDGILGASVRHQLQQNWDPQDSVFSACCGDVKDHLWLAASSVQSTRLIARPKLHEQTRMIFALVGDRVGLRIGGEVRQFFFDGESWGNDR